MCRIRPRVTYVPDSCREDIVIDWSQETETSRAMLRVQFVSYIHLATLMYQFEVTRERVTASLFVCPELYSNIFRRWGDLWIY